MNSSAFLVSRKAARVSTLLLFGELFLDDALGELDPSSVLGPLGLPYLSRLVEKIQVLSAIEPLLPFRPRPEQSEAPRVKSSLQIGHQLQRRRGQHAFLPCMWRRGDLYNRRAKGESSSFLASDQWLERRAFEASAAWRSNRKYAAPTSIASRIFAAEEPWFACVPGASLPTTARRRVHRACAPPVLCFRPMIAKGLRPILNVSDIRASFVWFEKLGWKKLWHWGNPPTFGAVGSGKCEIFLCLGGQGGRGKGANQTTFGPGGDEAADQGVWMSRSVEDVDEVHRESVAAGLEIASPPTDMP